VTPLSRRRLLANAAAAAFAVAVPGSVAACSRSRPLAAPAPSDPDRQRLDRWVAAIRADGRPPREIPLGRDAIRVGELAAGTPYEAQTLEAYLGEGGSPAAEPLTLSLTRFDCVTLVEACIAVARVAESDEPTWERFGREVQRMRYRGGRRQGYPSRLHYFSEWIADGYRRGLLRDLGAELGGTDDTRPLRFMTEHRASYAALADERVFRAIGAVERSLDAHARRVVPTNRIAEVSHLIETGDVLGFATAIPGLDVTHAAFAYRGDDGELRVLHAPLSGGVVEVTGATLAEYVAAIRRSTGILVARPLRAGAA
jgi:hypothetical protein